MQRKGISLDVGRVMMGQNWRPVFDPKIVHRELEIIIHDLHCNAVRICGLDMDRLTAAAEDALKQGMEVWFSPEMWDRSQDATCDYIVKAAAAAEELCQQWPNQMVFSVGSELTLFMQGILPGDNFLARFSAPSFWDTVRSGAHNQPLNAFLIRASEAIRPIFRGPVTYMSAPLETVDWSPFDFVGVDLYRDARIRDRFGDLIRRYLVPDKPLIIGEFGCCTYRGAEDAGGMGWAILDFDQATGQMHFKGDYVRDEGVQAREIVEDLTIFDGAGVNGTFVYTFVAPTSPHDEDPKHDLDMASYSLVKSYSNRHGTTYPDMPWEPKESFQVVADYYANH